MDPPEVVLPSFCKKRHYRRASKVFLVPIWELPVGSPAAWSPGGNDAQVADEPQVPQVGLDSDEDFDGAVSDVGSDTWRFEYASCMEEASQDEQDSISEFSDDFQDEEQEDCFEDAADQGADGATGRNWSKGLLENASVLVRRDVPRGCTLALSAALFPSKSIRCSSDETLDRHMASVLRTREPRWAVLTLRSGHFAGAVFKGPSVVVHKTLHRYTTRAKQGGSQSACDSKGGKKTKSAGSNLRRYGEKRLGEEIQELLTSQWADELDACDLIFIAAPKRSQAILTGSQQRPFVPHHKLRPVPITIARPTFEAVREAHRWLAGVAVAAGDSIAEQLTAAAGGNCKPKASTNTAYSRPISNLTALHKAAADGDEDEVLRLLETGADPTATDAQGRVPYDLCLRPAAQRAFEFHRRLHSTAWDWSAARVPGSSDDDDSSSVTRRRRRGAATKERTAAVYPATSVCKAKAGAPRVKGGAAKGGDRRLSSAACESNRQVAGKCAPKGGAAPKSLRF